MSSAESSGSEDIDHRPTNRVHRVAFFDPYPHAYGGAQRVIEGLAAEIARRGIVTEVVTVGEGRLTERLSASGIPWRAIRLPRSLMFYGHRTRGTRAVRAVLSLPMTWTRVAMKLRGTQIAHVCDLRGMILFAPAARLVRCRVVWHVNFPDPARVLNRCASFLADCIVSPSEDARNRLEGVKPSDITVIPNGIPSQPFEQSPPDFSEPVVVTAGRLAPEKGLDVLLDAMSQVVTAVPKARLLVQGAAQGGYEGYGDRLKNQAEELGIDSAVTFVGFIPEPWREWARTSLYVQASREESFGLAAAEAMAASLPVVSTEVGAMRHLVIDGVTGLLVKPDDPEGLARAMVALLNDCDRARAMGRAGRELVAQHFSFAVMADLVLEAYEAVA